MAAYYTVVNLQHVQSQSICSEFCRLVSRWGISSNDREKQVLWQIYTLQYPDCRMFIPLLGATLVRVTLTGCVQTFQYLLLFYMKNLA